MFGLISIIDLMLVYERCGHVLISSSVLYSVYMYQTSIYYEGIHYLCKTWVEMAE